MKFESKEIEKSKDLYKFEITVPISELSVFQEEAYKELSKEVKIEGFRPGKAPRAKIEQVIGSKLITEAVNKLIIEVAIQFIEKNDFKPTSTPLYDLKDFGKDGNITFTISFVNFPKVTLGEIESIKVKKEEVKVEEKEVNDLIKMVIKNSMKKEEIEQHSKIVDIPIEKKEADNKNKKEEIVDNKNLSQTDFDFELNDNLIKALKYEKEQDLKSLQESVRTRITTMKKDQVDRKYEEDVITEAVSISQIEIPKSFLESEIKGYESEFNSRIKDLKLDPKVFLEAQGSSLEKKQEEWKKEAERRLSIYLLLIAFAEKNGIVATNEEVEEEINSISDLKVRKSYENTEGREYIRTVITRQKAVNKILEIVKSK